ncbi:hypothetical protein [Pilimelia columellifera]|uniref:DUF2716 domain-containing protein n=1 Tax=Pilimelia columellifera subsp. columellifera TaxID=706583 RepID=A0ABN3NP89_9ACTN
MGLRFCPDTAAADWLVRTDTPVWQLIEFGPQGFEAFVRLRFIPDPSQPGQSEADVHLPEDHPSDIAQARRAVRLLAGFTTTPDDCYFCLWEGYSNIPLPALAQRGPFVDTPHRRYVLLRGAAHDIDAWETDLGDGSPIAPPAFVWPADRRWCFASDVDPHWAGIGAERAAVDALVRDAGLDVVAADPTQDQPLYY